MENKYQIVLQQQSQQNRNKRDFSLESDGCNSTQLFNYSVSQEKGLTCYITAEIDVETDGETTFNIGDGKTYGGYENVALAPGADYLLVVVVLVKAERAKVAPPSESVDLDTINQSKRSEYEGPDLMSKRTSSEVIDDTYSKLDDDTYSKVVDDTYSRPDGPEDTHTYDKIEISNRSKSNKPSSSNVNTASSDGLYINRLGSY
ncbi:hypothetical protein EB796_015805 [Bugula neritina]|uniref:Receptor-type tyrosine-protein phosphatase U-like Fn3 domain-containing protein n=1 Tax=Bugula neritina TaxID=10212 RepID=A0A7J7JII9_BUGNE|nr:hypothetical protein EB796_015805 [Bugula neritina]